MQGASSRAEHATSLELFSLSKLGCVSPCVVIEREMMKLPGINYAVVSYLTDDLIVNYDPTKLTTDEIRKFLRKL